MAPIDNALPRLQAIIETCQDSQDGYRIAVNHTENPALKGLFFTIASERTHFAAELETMIQTQGGAAQPNADSPSALHTAWLNFKSTLLTGNEAAILAECIAGEESAVALYEETLEKEELSPEVREMLIQQAGEIRESLVKFQEMHAMYEPPPVEGVPGA